MVIRYVSNSELRPRQFLTSHNKWQSDNALWFLSHATKKIKNIRPWESKRSFDAQLSGNLTGDTFFLYFKTVSDCGNICRVCSALTPKNVHTRTLSHGYRGFRQDFKDVHLGKVCRAVNIFAAMFILAMIFESKGRKLCLRAVLSKYMVCRKIFILS